MARASRFWVAWMTNTIRNVMTVVAVLTTSCQESEYAKSGPDTAHRTMRARPMTNAAGDPTHSEVLVAKRRKRSRIDSLPEK
jgi:hypothetical protein